MDTAQVRRVLDRIITQPVVTVYEEQKLQIIRVRRPNWLRLFGAAGKLWLAHRLREELASENFSGEPFRLEVV